MSTTTTDVKAEPVSPDKKPKVLYQRPLVSKSAFFRKNLKDEVLSLIKKCIENGNVKTSKMYDIIQSNKYREARNLGFYNILLEDWIDGCGLSFLIYYSGLEHWKTSPFENNFIDSIELFENTIISMCKGDKFLNEWKSSPYHYDLYKYSLNREVLNEVENNESGGENL